MKIHIVKRNLNLSDDKSLNQKASTGFLSQSASGRKPVGWDAKIGDQIWVHEVGYGITKYGTVTRKSTDIYVVPEGDFTSLINLFQNNETKIKDKDYWWDLIHKMINNPKKNLQYIEFELDYTYLTEAIPCSFKFQGGWLTLSDEQLSQFEKDKQMSFLENTMKDKNIELLKNIPTKIKFEIFNLLRLSNEDKLVIDYDHVIPRHVGGLGCFIENIHPLPKAVNRSKNKSVPRALFDVAREYNCFQFQINSFDKMYGKLKDEFSKDEIVIKYAREIMTITHQWDFNDQKQFYSKVLQLYDLNYYNKITKK